MSQTILLPFEVHQRVYLRGMTMGVSWRKENLPYASRVIWRYLGTNPDKRQMLSRCGVLPLSSRQLPATVRSYLEAPPLNIPECPGEFLIRQEEMESTKTSRRAPLSILCCIGIWRWNFG